jgi:hypothetical protein
MEVNCTKNSPSVSIPWWEWLKFCPVSHQHQQNVWYRDGDSRIWRWYHSLRYLWLIQDLMTLAKTSILSLEEDCFILKHCWSQGILKGEVSLYHWPPVWLVCKYKQKLSVVIQLIPIQSNRRSVVQWYSPL